MKNSLVRWVIIAVLLALLCVLVPSPALVSASAEITPLPLDDQSVGYPFLQEGIKGDAEYEDESIHVTIEHVEYRRVSCIVCRITIKDPSQLRTIAANDNFKDTEVVRVNTMVNKSNAVLALNGDYFKFNASGYLVRQMTVHRNRATAKRDLLMIDQNGDFLALKTPTQEEVDAFLKDNPEIKVVNSFNFGPILVKDGVAQEITTSDFQPDSRMQRIAIAQTGPLSYAVFQCEGTVDDKNGLLMSDFATFITQNTPNIKLAYNLDGGGSCQLFFLGKRQNYNPDTRRLCDMIYFCTAVQGGEQE